MKEKLAAGLEYHTKLVMLTQAGNVVSRTAVQCITNSKMKTSEVQQFAKEYDEKLSDIMNRMF